MTEEELLLLKSIDLRLKDINESLRFLGMAILSGNTADPKNMIQSYTKAFMQWFREQERNG